jgi:hypothetical protein
VGVGALAGSTIMLLTIPWFLSILGGRVNIDATGKANYSRPKLTPPGNMSLTQTGVTLSNNVNIGSYIMLVTSLTYLLLQVPGLIYLNSTREEQIIGERNWALFGFFVCLFFFLGYLWYQYKISLEDSADSTQSLAREQYYRDAISSGKITLIGVMSFSFADQSTTSTAGAYQKDSTLINGKNEKTGLLGGGQKTVVSDDPQNPINKLERLLRPFFNAYDLVSIVLYCA